MRTVDGARGKWSLLILLDAIIYILSAHPQTTTVRRYFNQQRVLCDCIIAELNAADRTQIEVSQADFDNFVGDISVVSLPIQWVSLESFREYHSNNAPTKARTKFLSVLESLTTHPCIMECFGDLSTVLKKVVLKVIADHGFSDAPQLASLPTSMPSVSLTSQSPHSPRSPSRRSMSIDSGMEANLFMSTRLSSQTSPTKWLQKLSQPSPAFHQQYPLSHLPYPSRPPFLDDCTNMAQFLRNPFTSGQIQSSFPSSVSGSTTAEDDIPISKSASANFLASDWTRSSADTLCPDTEGSHFRPSCSTVDDDEVSLPWDSPVAISQSEKSFKASLPSSNSIQSLVHPRQVPISLDISSEMGMDVDDLSTPKENYDWVDFVHDFSNDGAGEPGEYPMTLSMTIPSEVFAEGYCCDDEDMDDISQLNSPWNMPAGSLPSYSQPVSHAPI